MADRRAPVFKSASTSIDGTKVILTYDELLGARTATKNAFAVKVGRDWVAVDAVTVIGHTVELKLAGMVRSGQAVTVSYAAPTASGLPTNTAIQDLAGNDAATLSNRSVTNISTLDGRAPVLQSASTSVDGTKVILTYDEFLAATTASKSAFSVKAGGAAVAVSAVAVNGATVELTLARAVRDGQKVTVGYSTSVASGTTANAAIQDHSGNAAATLSNRSVTNISAVDGTGPVFRSASTSADGTKVILTYNEELATTTATKGLFAVKVGGAAVAVSTVAVNGATVELTLASAVRFGQGVTVAYRPPNANSLTSNAAIQDIIGNDAARFETTNVTNAVNRAAVIGGAKTGAVTEDAAATLSTSGALTVTDQDRGQAYFVAQSSTVGANGYGSFTLAANGVWSYAADNTQTAIQALGAGETLTDRFTAVTADGTTQVVTVTITGVNEFALNNTHVIDFAMKQGGFSGYGLQGFV